jgi:hypothetical protein
MRSKGVVVLLAAVSACREPLSRVALRHDVLGCFAVAYADSAWASRWSAPRYLVLDSVPKERAARRLRFEHRDDPVGGDAPHRWGWWSADSLSETIRLTVTDGFVGVELVVTGTADSLVGRGTAQADVGRANRARGPVIAHRISCTALPSLEPAQQALAT